MSQCFGSHIYSRRVWIISMEKSAIWICFVWSMNFLVYPGSDAVKACDHMIPPWHHDNMSRHLIHSIESIEYLTELDANDSIAYEWLHYTCFMDYIVERTLEMERWLPYLLIFQDSLFRPHSHRCHCHRGQATGRRPSDNREIEEGEHQDMGTHGG